MELQLVLQDSPPLDPWGLVAVSVAGAGVQNSDEYAMVVFLNLINQNDLPHMLQLCIAKEYLMILGDGCQKYTT